MGDLPLTEPGAGNVTGPGGADRAGAGDPASARTTPGPTATSTHPATAAPRVGPGRQDQAPESTLAGAPSRPTGAGAAERAAGDDERSLRSEVHPDEQLKTGPRHGAHRDKEGGLDETAAAISVGTVERSAWSLVWLAVLVGGLGFWGSWSAWAPGAVLAPLLVVAGIAGLAASWMVRSPRSPFLQLAALAAVAGSTFGSEAIGIHLRQFYSTDSGAFNEAAARLLLNGKNPYTSSMASATQLLQHPANNWTYTVGGGYVNHVSYPAGSFLLPVPALAMGLQHAVVDWIDLVAWIVTGVLIFALLPASLRWLGCLLLAVPIFAAIFGSGGTDAAFLPFMVLAVWRWDRFALGKRAGAIRWMGPIALGLACSMKQTPWFCLPFLLLGIFMEARNAGRKPLRPVAGYAIATVAAFAAVNIPFVIWQPDAWARGTFLPFSQPLVADGQGLVTLVLHGFAHGAALRFLDLAGALAFVSLLVTFVAAYSVMKRVWLIVLPISFFLATRSLSSYLLDLYPAALVAAMTVAPGGTPTFMRRPSRSSRAVVATAAGSALAAVLTAILAFTSVPLQIDIRGTTADATASTIQSVTIAVHNSTDRVLNPHFMVTIGSDHPDGFWLLPGGRQIVLGPHASKVMTLFPSHRVGAPGHDAYWLVAAYTTSPEALSTSPVRIWRLGHP